MMVSACFAMFIQWAPVSDAWRAWFSSAALVGFVLSCLGWANEHFRGDTVIKKKARGIAAQLLDFGDMWEAKKPNPSTFDRLGPIDPNDPDLPRKWDEAGKDYADKISKHRIGMQREFVFRYAGSVTALRDELAGFGVRSNNLDQVLHRIISWGCASDDMRVLATEIQQLAEKVKN